MKKAEVTKLLNSGFKKMLDENNFKKRKYGYIKKSSDGIYYEFGFSTKSYDICFPTTFYYGIGLNSVKEILKLILPEYFEMPENEYPTIFSMGQKKLYTYNNYPLSQYEIYTEADVLETVNEISEYFINTGLPYLKSISSINKLEQITNAELNPGKKNSGLILAKLVNNPEYETLKNKYREILKEWPDWDKQELEKVIMFLDSHSQEALLKIAEG